MALISLGLAAGKAILGGKSSSSAARPQVKQSKISSSAFRSQRATTQKIPKTTPLGGYGFSGGGGPLPKNAFLMPQVSRGGDTLEETNNILIDIQKLLVLDFSYRIESAKQLEKNIRAETEQKRRSRKEALLEGGKKIGRATSSVISKITAPAKSFLDKVFGFLGSIFQGFLANKALKWLADEKNQEKVGKVFKFIEKNWKILLGIAGGLVGGVVVAKVFSKLYTMYRITRGLLGLIGIGRRGRRGGGGDTLQDGGRPGRGGFFRNAAGRRRGFNTVKTGNLQQMKDKFGRNKGLTEVYKTTKNPLSKFVQRLQVVGGRGASNIFRKIGLKGAVKFLRPLLKRIPLVGALLDFGISLLLGEPIGRAAAKSVGALIGGIFGSVLGPFGSVGGAILGDMAGSGIYDFFAGMGGAEGMNSGGIVPGGGPNKDSVLTYLTPGEGVVKREDMSDDRFGPFVKDIIYNSGGLYSAMVFALRKLEFSSDEFLKVNKQFGEILDDYTNTIKASSQSIQPSSGPTRVTPPPKPSVSPPPPKKTTGLVGDPQNDEGGISFLNMDPIIQGGQEQGAKNVPADNSFANYEPIDLTNPYLAYVKKEFGLLGD